MKKLLSKAAIITSLLILLASCGMNSADTSLKKAGPESLDEEIRMYFPGLENFRNGEKLDNTGISVTNIGKIDLDNNVTLTVLGRIALSGRVAVVEEMNIDGIDLVKVYLLYSKNDCSDFMVKFSEPYKISRHDLLYPFKMTSPRYVKNVVITILNPDDSIKTLVKGNYFSFTGDWGNIEGDKNNDLYGRDSYQGMSNFYVVLKQYDVKKTTGSSE